MDNHNTPTLRSPPSVPSGRPVYLIIYLATAILCVLSYFLGKWGWTIVPPYLLMSLALMKTQRQFGRHPEHADGSVENSNFPSVRQNMTNRNRRPRRYGQKMSILDILGTALAVGVALGFGAAMGYIVILKFELLQAAVTYIQTH